MKHERRCKPQLRSHSPSSAKGSPRIGLSSNSSTSSSCSISSTKSKNLEEKRSRDLERKIFKKNYSGETLLIKMAKKGDFATIKTLIKEGANINEQDYAGWTALHECSIRNHSHIVIYLLKHKANPNLCGGKGDTPLHDAARLGHAKVVKYLLRFGANPKIVNENGHSPLDVATNKEVQNILNKFLNKESTPRDDAISENISEDASLTDYDPLEGRMPSSSSGAKAPKKDPYAFDDDELESNEDLKKSLSIGIGSGQPSRVDLSPIGPPLRLRFAKESGFYHLKEQENSNEKDSAGPKSSPISSDFNQDEVKDKTDPEKQRKNSGSIKVDEYGQRIPPLIIKLGSPEPGHENNDPSSFKKETASTAGSEENHESEKAKKTDPGSEPDAASQDQPASPSQSTTNQSSPGMTSTAPPRPSSQTSFRQMSASTSSRRESRSGRTLRSHTAALREKEKKDYTKSFYSNSGPPKKRRLQNSKSEQGSTSAPQNINQNSQDSAGGEDAREEMIHGSSFTQDMSSDENPDDLDMNSFNDPSDEANNVQYTQNPYENALILEKEKMDLISKFSTVEPKFPNGYDQYLIKTRNYFLADNLPKSIYKRPVPSNITDPVFVELFGQQENERYVQELKHLSERENLRISAEQSILRLYNKTAIRSAGNPRQLSFCNVINLLDMNNVPNIFENLKQSQDSIKSCQLKKKEQENRESYKSLTGSFQDVIDHFQVEKKRMLCRQLHEADALMMVQKLDWEMKNKELLNINTPFDNMTVFKDIPNQNVPPILVPDDFPLFPREHNLKTPR